MATSFSKKLQQLADKHGLNGDMQSILGREFSHSKKAQLFEFYDEEDAEFIYDQLCLSSTKEIQHLYELFITDQNKNQEENNAIRPLHDLMDSGDVSGEFQLFICDQFYPGEGWNFETIPPRLRPELELMIAKSTLDTLRKDYKQVKENEVSTSTLENTTPLPDEGESQPKGGAVAAPGQATAAPSFQLREVYDGEAGQIVQRSVEQQAAAHSLYSLLKMVDLAQAIILKKFLDGDHHLDLGYSTREEFAQNELGVGIRTMQQRVKVAERFENLIPINDTNPGSPLLQLSEIEQQNLEAINKIGIRKLYEVARVEDADFTEVLNTGVVTFDDGRTIALEEIQIRTKTELSNLFKKESDGYKERNAKLLDKNSELEAKKKQAEKEIESLKEKVERAERLELMYADQAANLEAFETLLKLGEEAAREMNKMISRVKIPDNCPEDLKVRIVSLRQIVDAGSQVLYQQNYEAFAGAIETRTNSDGEEFDVETGEVKE